MTSGGADERAVATSYRCLSLYVDSTGRSPSRSPSLVAPSGVLVHFRLDAAPRPVAVDVRLYAGAGISASFLRWPEELPTGVEPVDSLQPTPSLTFQYLPDQPPGEYSLVVKAVWDGPVDVFYAISFRLE